MERAVIVVAGTVAGVAGVLMYTPRPPALADALPEAPAPAPSAQAPAAAPAATPTASAAAVPSPSPTPETVQTIAGPLVETAFGPVQVAVTVQGGVITAVDAVTYPDKDPKSITIAKRAIPVLVQETLEAQSGDIATVSGASYTSDGWKQSVAGALAQLPAA